MASSLADTAAGSAGRAISGRQLAALFLYSLVNWIVGNGLLPLLPKFATELGASPPVIGLYLGVSYASIAIGTAFAGWLSDRFGRRRPLMIALGFLTAPLLAATSQVTAFWQLVGLTITAWFLAGMAVTFASILAGLSAGPEERGRVLGFVVMAAPVGSIIGGLGVGWLADAFGFGTMFIVLGLVLLGLPAFGSLVEDVPAPPRGSGSPSASAASVWTAAFLILLAAGVTASVGSFISALGRTFVMQGTFTNADITSTVAVSGIVTLPFPFLLGSLSDRTGRLRILALCYAAGATGLVIYAAATALWQFWVAAGLVAFISYVSTGVGSALVVDLVDRPAVGRGLALFNVTGWMGGVIGFAAGGYLFASLGFSSGFLVGAGLLLLTLLLLLPLGFAIRNGPRRGAPARPGAASARKE